MTPRRPEDIFNDALDLDPEEREAFLAGACAGDENLRAEVESLLEVHDHEDRALRAPIDSPDTERTHIGPYRILDVLGEGGMGVVYRVEDPELKREIALKMLPERLARHPARRARFEREARLLAAISHPNIATIHTLGDAEGLRFLTMELIPGETLFQRISRGPMPVEEALLVFRQVALALEAAHQRGVIHRDLKPLNIMITPEARVKVFDFGLARTAPAATGLPTLPDLLTTGRMILGTPGYLSPEQASGGSLDERVDIWALGCCLYEALCGQPIFPGEAPSERIAAVLQREPDWDALPPEVPARLRKLLARCCAREPDHRPRNAAEVRREIEEILAQRSLPPRRVGDPAPHNLPVRLATFVGRERQKGAVRRALRDNRLVTLTGAGGCGKTSLAIEAGRELLDAYPDGVWLVELSRRDEGSSVPQAVAAVLGAREEPHRTLTASLVGLVSPRRLLLILDNCEHVIEPTARLVDALLRAGPDLRILTTSREALGITGEVIQRVPSLAVPGEQAPIDPEGLLEVEAVRLFVDRAMVVDPGFRLDAAKAPAVIQICRRLDGIPLAIELAAARARVLPVEEIARRLDDRFRLLAAGGRDAFPQQRTLRALVDWSYEHLTPAERALLRRLSVFVGGWTLEAAEAVCPGGDLESWDVLDLLCRLAEKSLLELDAEGAERTGQTRYRMLETMREYGRDRLSEDPEEAARIRLAHRDYYLTLAERAEPELTGPDQMIWLARLEVDHGNLRAALDVCAKNAGDSEKAMRLAGALGWFWLVRGRWSEGRSACAWAFALSGVPGKNATTTKVLHWLGNLAFSQGDLEEARAFYEQALAIQRELEDLGGVAAALNNLGRVSRADGDEEGARALFRESLALYRRTDDRHGTAEVLTNLGELAEAHGNLDRARANYEECLAVHRELDDGPGIAGTLARLGVISEKQANDPEAMSFHEESLALAREIPDRSVTGSALTGIGRVLTRAGQLERAEDALREALSIRVDLGERAGAARSLLALAGLAGVRRDWARAARLLAAAGRLRESIGDPPTSLEAEERSRQAAALRESMGEGAFTEAWNDGRRFSQEQAHAYALGRAAGA